MTPSSARRSSAVPSRRTPISTLSPGLAPISLTISVQLATGIPATLVTRSPGRMAAPSAADPGVTRPTRGSTQGTNEARPAQRRRRGQPASARRSSRPSGISTSKLAEGDAVTTLRVPAGDSRKARWIWYHDSGSVSPIRTIRAPEGMSASASAPAGSVLSATDITRVVATVSSPQKPSPR